MLHAFDVFLNKHICSCFEKDLSSIFTWHVVWKDYFVAKDKIESSVPPTFLVGR